MGVVGAAGAHALRPAIAPNGAGVPHWRHGSRHGLSLSELRPRGDYAARAHGRGRVGVGVGPAAGAAGAARAARAANGGSAGAAGAGRAGRAGRAASADAARRRSTRPWGGARGVKDGARRGAQRRRAAQCQRQADALAQAQATAERGRGAAHGRRLLGILAGGLPLGVCVHSQDDDHAVQAGGGRGGGGHALRSGARGRSRALQCAARRHLGAQRRQVGGGHLELGRHG